MDNFTMPLSKWKGSDSAFPGDPVAVQFFEAQTDQDVILGYLQLLKLDSSVQGRDGV